MECKHDKWEYAIDYTPSESSGCETCGTTDSSFYINRYCAECKKQFGYIDPDHSVQYTVTSVELDELFRRKDERDRLNKEAKERAENTKRWAIETFGRKDKKYGQDT